MAMEKAIIQQALGDALLESLEAAEAKVDSEIERLEKLDEDDLESIRRKRIEEMKKTAKLKAEWRTKGHGTYGPVADQKNFFKEVKGSKRVVAHFARSTTWRCEIIDKHLAALAPKHVETKFVRVDAEKSPYIVEKLNIWMLPTLVLIKDGHTDHSIVGFDEFGGSDDFKTSTMEQVLLAHGLLLESFT